MKNTREKGVVHFCIFKWNGRYIGICRETGFVEEAGDFSVVRQKLQNGTTALVLALHKSKQNLEPSVNTSPPFKYLIYYYLAPLLAFIESRRSPNADSYSFYSGLEIDRLLKAA